MSELFAHSLAGRLPEHWHRLDDHLEAVAERARQSANAFSSGDWAFNAGWLHDVGKAAAEFQAYLRRENGLDDSEYDCAGSFRVNHSSAGAVLAEQRFNIATGLVLAYLAAGHHMGIRGTVARSTLVAQLYRCRWSVALFFKWVRQHLRITVFYGTSTNAVKTQVWIAIASYVLVAIPKKRLGTDASLYTIPQILRISIFGKTPILQAISQADLTDSLTQPCNQLELFDLRAGDVQPCVQGAAADRGHPRVPCVPGTPGIRSRGEEACCRPAGFPALAAD